jgi:hypothetical protein
VSHYFVSAVSSRRRSAERKYLTPPPSLIAAADAPAASGVLLLQPPPGPRRALHLPTRVRHTFVCYKSNSFYSHCLLHSHHCDFSEIWHSYLLLIHTIGSLATPPSRTESMDTPMDIALDMLRTRMLAIVPPPSSRKHSMAIAWFPHLRPRMAQRTLSGLLHSCYTVVTLLPHCCHTVVTRLLHGCYTVVTRLLHCCCTVVTPPHHLQPALECLLACRIFRGGEVDSGPQPGEVPASLRIHGAPPFSPTTLPV